MRKARSTGEDFDCWWAGCKSGEDSCNLQGTGESCLLAMPCNKIVFSRWEKNLFTEQVPILTAFQKLSRNTETALLHNLVW